MRIIRFNNRKNVDELIAPILNLDLVDMYYDLFDLTKYNKRM